ncbi:MAG: response regulator transcription factor [Ktedonobacterales bacterium]
MSVDPMAVHPESRGAVALVDLDQLDTQPLPSQSPAALRRHILVVEDDSRVASVIHASLELEGEPDWAVQMATGGKRALELASVTPPDLVLLDVRLPDLDGAQVYHRLRTNPATRPARILFLSAGTSFDLFRLGIEDGVLLRKPFNVPELVSLVRALLYER